MNSQIINALISAQLIPPFPHNRIIGTIPLQDYNSTIVMGDLYSGVNANILEECDRWPDFTGNCILKYIHSGSQIPPIIMVEDKHWQWIRKYQPFASSDHTWFYLMATGVVEAICITYYPKDSEIHGNKIFYIEYLSIAPWNRYSNLHNKKYKSFAKDMVDKIQEHYAAINGAILGYGLHALPQATRFYQSIGMINIPSKEKDGLPYYEMNTQ